MSEWPCVREDEHEWWDEGPTGTHSYFFLRTDGRGGHTTNLPGSGGQVPQGCAKKLHAVSFLVVNDERLALASFRVELLHGGGGQTSVLAESIHHGETVEIPMLTASPWTLESQENFCVRVIGPGANVRVTLRGAFARPATDAEIAEAEEGEEWKGLGR